MYQELRRRTYRLFAPSLGGRAGYFTDWFIMVLITVNVLAVMLETVDTLGAQYESVFYWFEVFSVAVFTVEYVARIWSSVEGYNADGEYIGVPIEEEYGGLITSRLKFASRPLLIVDFLAILPFYLAALGVGIDLRFLRALRLIRILRLLKLARYSESLLVFRKVIILKKPDIVIALLANLILLAVASSALYFVETAAQPDAFTSIPRTMWWGVITLTTVGYGDMVPITPLGQLLAGVTAVLGIGLFALPASILASGFMEVARGDSPECPHCGKEIDLDKIDLD